MKDGLLNIITYEGKAFDECNTERKGMIVVFASKLERLEEPILKCAEAVIDISANRITVSGLSTSLKTKVLDQIYKK